MNVSVCYSVCLFVREHISEKNRSDRHQLFMLANYGRGSVLLGRRGDMLCTSGLMDDVMLARNGEAWATRKLRILRVTHQQRIGGGV